MNMRLFSRWHWRYPVPQITGMIAAMATMVYAHAGWNGVCLAGALVSGTALLFWALTRHLTPRDTAA